MTCVNDFVREHEGVGHSSVQALGRCVKLKTFNKTSNKLVRLPDKVCMCLACVLSA